MIFKKLINNISHKPSYLIADNKDKIYFLIMIDKVSQKRFVFTKCPAGQIVKYKLNNKRKNRHFTRNIRYYVTL